jgi:hypothetical protein
MLKAFDGHMFRPHDILIVMPIELGGKTITIEVEIVNALLEYNLLLSCTRFYDMTTFILSLFWVLRFPHQVKVITIDQLTFYTPYLRTYAGSNIPFVGDS